MRRRDWKGGDSKDLAESLKRLRVLYRISKELILEESDESRGRILHCTGWRCAEAPEPSDLAMQEHEQQSKS